MCRCETKAIEISYWTAQKSGCNQSIAAAVYCICICAFIISGLDLYDLLVYVYCRMPYAYARLCVCLLMLPVLWVWWVSRSAMGHLSGATASCGHDWATTWGAGMRWSTVETRRLLWPSDMCTFAWERGRELEGERWRRRDRRSREKVGQMREEGIEREETERQSNGEGERGIEKERNTKR